MISHVNQVNCVERSLRDIQKVNKPFGGIRIVFAGDPRQDITSCTSWKSVKDSASLYPFFTTLVSDSTDKSNY